MDIAFYRPCCRLMPFVRYYWILKTTVDLDVLTFPIGCPQLIFHRKNRFVIPELDSEQAKFSVSGQVNFPARIQSSGEIETIVVVFYPHAVAALFGIPVSTFYNREIDGYSLEDKSLSVLADDVLEVEASDYAVAMIERWLLKRLSEPGIYDFNRIGASLRPLFLNTAVGVENMAQHACLGRKQFERVFYKAVGMMPKEYSNVVRFQKSLFLMQTGARNFSDIAYSCGYSDQSHFIRECRRYSGLPPGRLLKAQTVVAELFTSPVSDVSRLHGESQRQHADG